MTFQRVIVSCVLFGVLWVLVSLAGAGKPLRGIVGVELGMPSSAVVNLIKMEASSEPPLRTALGLSWRVPNHRLFRHAEFRFDDHGFLSEIVLSMREVLGAKKAVQELRKSYEVDLAGETTVVRDGIALKIVGNKLFITKDAQVAVAGTGQAQRTSGQQPPQ